MHQLFSYGFGNMEGAGSYVYVMATNFECERIGFCIGKKHITQIWISFIESPKYYQCLGFLDPVN